MFGKAQALFALLMLVVFSLVGCDNVPPSENPLLATAKQKQAQCVEPTEEMRKNHMEYILHQRDETMYKGIRSTKHSLNGCIECHIPPAEENKVVHYTDDHGKLNPEHFCATCHEYTSVNIDCFQCHVDYPNQQLAAAPENTVAAPAIPPGAVAPTDATHVAPAPVVPVAPATNVAPATVAPVTPTLVAPVAPVAPTAPIAPAPMPVAPAPIVPPPSPQGVVQ